MSLELEVGGAKRRELLECDKNTTIGSRQAVFVVHGMGQQKTFETQAQVATKLASAPSVVKATAIAKQLIAGEEKTGIVELELNHRDGSKQEFDIYEAYWAPLTEGQVTLRDVISFLFRTGITSLPRFTFRRWMFGKIEEKKAVTFTTVALAILLVTIASLVLINAIVATVLTARVATVTGSWPSDHLIVDLSVPSAMASVLMLLFGVMELLALQAKRRPKTTKPVRLETPLIWLIWLEAGVFLVSIVAAAAAMAAALWYHHGKAPQVSWIMANFGPELICRIWWTTVFGGGVALLLAALSTMSKSRPAKAFVYLIALGTAALIVIWICYFQAAWRTGVAGAMDEAVKPWAWVWILLFSVSWFARGFLVQYMGDVAAYVEPHRVDRFNELRDKIKRCVSGTANAIYRMGENATTLRYGKVIIVAHSLGSVIAYDVLNSLLRADQAAGGHIHVTARTGALITFGSPLDKFAYLFALQRGSDTQEALAGTVQPLLADAATRPKWINIHSHHDIISGKLDYYGKLDNLIDPDARVPFAAHVEYWENPLLWKTLLAVL